MSTVPLVLNSQAAFAFAMFGPGGSARCAGRRWSFLCELLLRAALLVQGWDACWPRSSWVPCQGHYSGVVPIGGGGHPAGSSGPRNPPTAVPSVARRQACALRCSCLPTIAAASLLNACCWRAHARVCGQDHEVAVAAVGR